jgi:hypothetical protein
MDHGSYPTETVSRIRHQYAQEQQTTDDDVLNLARDVNIGKPRRQNRQYARRQNDANDRSASPKDRNPTE